MDDGWLLKVAKVYRIRGRLDEKTWPEVVRRSTSFQIANVSLRPSMSCRSPVIAYHGIPMGSHVSMPRADPLAPYSLSSAHAPRGGLLCAVSA